jgi:hypothetical protein
LHERRSLRGGRKPSSRGGEKARISKKALAQVCSALDAKWAMAEASRQEYLDKIQAHTDRGKQVLDLDKMLGERKEELNGRE